MSVSISGVRGQEVTSTRNLPDQDAIDAFVLTFRFFYQDNEKSSFRQLSKAYEELPISPELKKNFNDWRNGLNDYLDKKISITVDSRHPSRRELLDIFIYGGLAHANPEKKTIYDEWKKVSFVYIFLETEFCSTLEDLLQAIRHFADLNKEAIEQLEKASKS